MISPSRESRSQDLHDLVQRLRDLIAAKSITRRADGERDFVLASGKTTRYYCDTKKVTLSPEGSQLTGEILYALLGGEADAVGGLELGATYIAAAVALISSQYGQPIYGFTVREEQKKHGTREKVAESYHPDGQALLSNGRRIAVVDDVVTKGGSINKAIDEVKARGCKIVRVIALVDRNEGGGDSLREQGLPYFALLNAKEPGTLTINDDLFKDPTVYRLHPS